MLICLYVFMFHVQVDHFLNKYIIGANTDNRQLKQSKAKCPVVSSRDLAITRLQK